MEMKLGGLGVLHREPRQSTRSSFLIRRQDPKGKTWRWPTKLLFLSLSLMAELCVPAGGNGVLSGGRALQLIPYWGTLRATAIAPSQTGSSPRTGAHLHQSGGSPGATRGQGASSSLTPAAQTRGSRRVGVLCPSFLSTHPSEGPGN